jgi:hypothetical protein
MALSFPSSPTVGQTFTSGTKIWQWDGYAWNSISGTMNGAVNILGGAASQIPYQTGANTTSFIANGSAGQVLTSNGTSAPTWTSVDAMPQIFMMMGA